MSPRGSWRASSGGRGWDEGAKRRCEVGGGKARGVEGGGEEIVAPRRVKEPNMGETAAVPWMMRVCEMDLRHF